MEPPYVIFDKSFLQALNLDEAVIFDALYASNITPLFYVETLADLEKDMRNGRSAEELVGGLANKTPEIHALPNVNHHTMAIGNLLGHPVEMRFVPAIGQGRNIITSGGMATIFDEPAETRALHRWRQRQFEEVDRDFARKYRASLAALPKEVGKLASPDGSPIRLKDLSTVKQLADAIVDAGHGSWPTLQAAIIVSGANSAQARNIIARWQKVGCPALLEFAPYAAYVLRVDLFLQIALTSGHISAERPSNRIDVTYLCYLPFTQIFASNDNLHARTAPLFLADGQRFFNLEPLKADLARLVKYYGNRAEEIAREGLFKVADRPPRDGDYLTSQIWDELRPGWRDQFHDRIELSAEQQAKLLEHVIGRLTPVSSSGPSVTSSAPPAATEFTDTAFKRTLPFHKGRWQLLPARVRKSDDET